MLTGRHPQQLRMHRNLSSQIKPIPRHPSHRISQPRRGDRTHRDSNIHRIYRNDLLVGHPINLGEHRAQTLMTSHHITDRRHQRRSVQLPGQPHRPRQVVRCRRALILERKPQPGLRKRQRHPLRPRPRHQLHPRQHTPTPSNPVSQSGHGGCLEDGSDRDLDAEFSADPGHQPGRGQRMPTQIEKPVINTHPSQPQHLGEQPGQHLLTSVARLTEHRRSHELRNRQRPPIQLAVGRQRQRLHHHHRRRHHVLRQPLTGITAQLSQ